MIHKRELRGYRRTTGVSLSSPNKLLTVGPFLLVAAAVIGVCGLATFATDQTDRLVSSQSSPQTISTNAAVETKADTTSGKPATLAEPIEVPSSTARPAPSQKGRTKPATTLTCNVSQRTAAINQRTSQINAESDRHENVLWSLQTTGLVTKVLNPSMYTYRINHENSVHAAKLKAIQATFAAAQSRAHC